MGKLQIKTVLDSLIRHKHRNLHAMRASHQPAMDASVATDSIAGSLKLSRSICSRSILRRSAPLARADIETFSLRVPDAAIAPVTVRLFLPCRADAHNGAAVSARGTQVERIGSSSGAQSP
jgi:hypothetical protein